jgi:Acyclic terpene utilisation family protein AtuA
MNDKVVRIGGASGFWGDSAIAAPQLVHGAQLDYLTFDYLAELTMSILSRNRAKNPATGYADDFVDVAMRSVLGEVAKRGIKVLSNAGGVNPRACADALRKLADEQGVALKIAVVEGDDLLPQLPALRSADVRDLHDGRALPARVLSANAYFGAWPIVQALRQGAQVVITGRCVDSALPLAALIHEFDWAMDDFDRLAAGSLAGHLIECGPQGTGGLFTDWEQVPDWENIGYPVIECRADGSFVITKPEGTGGLVTPATVAEQMLYEIGDPGAYLLPDVSCDFTGVRMEQVGAQQVRVAGARGRAPTDQYKVCATHADGWRCVINVTVVGGRAEAKARRIAEAVLARTRRMMGERGIADYRRVYQEVIGTEALFGPHSRVPRSREVILRLVVEHDDAKALEIIASEIASAGVSWAPGLSSTGGGRVRPVPIVRLFSFLWPKREAPATVAIGDAGAEVTPGPEARADAAPMGAAASTAITSAKPARSVYGALPSNDEDQRVEVPLERIAHGRSGDKGDSVNIGIIARHPKWLPVLSEQLTAQRVQAYFAHLVNGPVQRFDVPGIHAFNFLLAAALDGGGMASPRSDPLGKGFAQMLLDLPMHVPRVLLADGEGREVLGLAPSPSPSGRGLG